MICTTIRQGAECNFMTAKGCGYNGGMCYTTIDKCEGCDRKAQFETGWYCASNPEPAIKWKNGNCNLATHVKEEAKAKKAKINPIKASKRGH